MDTLALQNKLKEQFNTLVREKSNLLALEGFFDAMDTKEFSQTQVPEEHYQLVRERREKYKSGETEGKSWEEVKAELVKKYGF
jgi:hypothetical protein